ncbi:tryptophan synthase alpha chain [Salsuginibacillus halophilus]|uniref:Tryptophan synthase alpha chain n=1 Tax=Salsuginibacillus halophilus TaxID=517424 RepID=A0A2P8HW95_9BACI|nr:tryptophan synthase subunit alpha [Salsuginibacillus halophilus]PSL50503.1 tryptophan synthase alpha chain [Salsuginibacillus halophilus]
MNTSIEKAAANAAYPVFIPFIMAGDPNEEATIETALTLQEAGAHILELGIPYSDPLADGPVIQEAAERSLAGGMTLKKALALVPKMRERGLNIPVVIFTYYNPVYQMGLETFAKAAAENEADGLLIPDLPLEESEVVRTSMNEHGLELISLVAPTSKARIERIAQGAQGFLYIVSSLGVTGTRDELAEGTRAFIEEVKAVSPVPAAAGFGISKPEHVKALEGAADGVIVGSAIVRIIAQFEEELREPETRPEALEKVKALAVSLVTMTPMKDEVT